MNLGGLEPHWWWLAVAVLFAGLELVVPGVFLIWLAAAAALTGLVALTGIPLAFQFASFALLAIATVHWGRRFYDRNPVASSDPLLNDRAARLIGESVVVAAAIEGGSGRVRVGDGVWNAKGPDAAAGERVRVVGAEGNTLRVERIALPPAQ